MKKIEFENPNKMKIDTGLKIFDKQTNLITPRNAFCNTQKSSLIRAYNNTDTAYGGNIPKEGEYQKFDLKAFQSDMPFYVQEKIRTLAATRNVYVYEFFHIYKKHTKMVHGYVVTTTNHEFLDFFVTGRSHKSYQVIQECARYVSDYDSSNEAYKRMTVV